MFSTRFKALNVHGKLALLIMMLKMKIFPVLLLLFFCTVLETELFAKRLAPAVVAPLVINGIKYEAHYKNWKFKDKAGGYLSAQDNLTHRPLWELRVYPVSYNMNLETDVQDVHIKFLTAKNGKIIVQNEKGMIYEVNPRTKKISKVPVP